MLTKARRNQTHHTLGTSILFDPVTSGTYKNSLELLIFILNSPTQSAFSVINGSLQNANGLSSVPANN